MRWGGGGGLVGFRRGAWKKMAIEGGAFQKNKGKKGGGGHVKYFSKTLKWHNA